MDWFDLASWLLRHAGPSIRFRTLVDILHEQDVGMVSEALDGMLESREVKDWLQRIIPRFDLNDIHSGNPEAFENVMGKLVLLGQRAGLQPFDNKTLPFRAWLADSLERTPTEPHWVFKQTIIASLLAYAGYGETSPVIGHLSRRLKALASFAQSPDFDSIYVDKTEHKGIPESSDKYPLVNPALYPDQHLALPWVHDIRGIAFCEPLLENVNLRRASEQVVNMILSEDYQRLPWSYGIAKYGERYYVIGWAVHLPGYEGRPEGEKFAELLLNLEMMAQFECARKSEWFTNSLQYLEKFRTEDGIYNFPREWLPDKKVGYWVGGLRLGIEEDRKSDIAIQCESTFWVLRIKRLAGLL